MTLRVGLVAEGPCDWLVLEAVMQQLHPDIAFVRLEPDRTLAMPRLQGWRGVRNWCAEYGPRLEIIMNGPGDPLDLLVIHVDCSMADQVGANRPCPPASDTADALAGAIDSDWLRRVPRPSFVVLALPAMTTDAWVVATLDPPYANLAAIEGDRAAEDQLARPIWGSIKRLPYKDGVIKKTARTYEPFAERVGANLALVRRHCSMAERFCGDFGAAVPLARP